VDDAVNPAASNNNAGGAGVVHLAACSTRCPVRLSGERVCADAAAIFKKFTCHNQHKSLLDPCKFLSISQFISYFV
jgi:hypothetical protein